MNTYKCIHCKKESSLEDSDTNWVSLHRRNGRRMLGCECGYGLFAGQITSQLVKPDLVEEQIKALRKKGVDPYEKTK